MDLIAKSPIVPRTRPSCSVVAAAAARVALLRAPAGYGKTSLLRQWHADLAARGIPVTIVDRADELAPAEAAELRRVIASAPPSARFVLAARGDVSVPLGRLRLAGELHELGPDELAFDEAELAALLAARSARADQVRPLLERTEGWVGGIVALLARDGRRALRDYFLEEVLAGLPSEMREFLCISSLLSRFSAELCDLVAERQDSRAMLDRLEAAGLFLCGLDERGQWYRYHPLFQEFLSRMLTDRDPVRARELHLRAAEALEGQGMLAEACEHAIEAKAPALAATLLNKRVRDFNRGGRTFELVRLADRLPLDSLGAHPPLLLMTAWVRSTEWKFEAARAALEEVGKALADLAADPHCGAEADQLRFLFLHQQMMLAEFADDMPEVERLCTVMLQEKAQDPHLLGTIYDSLLFAQRERFNLQHVKKWEAEVLGRIGLVGNVYSLIWHKSIMAPTRFLAGDIDGALADLDQAIQVASNFSATSAATAAGPALLAAELHYERNRLDLASGLLDRHFAPDMKRIFVDQLVAGFLTRSRLLHRQGDPRGALSLLQAGMKLAEERGFLRLKRNILGEMLRQMEFLGMPVGILVDAEPTLRRAPGDYLPSAAVTSSDEALALAWVRAARSHGRAAEALPVARRWRSFTASAGAIRSGIRWDIQIAQLEVMMGDSRSAQKVLRRAVELACRAGFIRSFVDEGEVVRGLLAEQAAASRVTVTDADRFVATLLQAFGGTTESRVELPDALDGVGVGRPLSQREIEILLMAGSGLRNKEIAIKFGMTEGTVKWYLQQIYDKVGTRRRAGLVERARQLGLLKAS